MMIDVKDIKKTLKTMGTKIKFCESKLSDNKPSDNSYLSINHVGDKFDYNIPLQTLDEFEKFDAELSDNESLYCGVVSILFSHYTTKNVARTFFKYMNLFR